MLDPKILLVLKVSVVKILYLRLQMKVSRFQILKNRVTLVFNQEILYMKKDISH